MTKQYLAGLAIGVFSIAGAPSAQATIIQNTVGLSDPHSTITFDEHVLPGYTPVTTQYSDQGVTFNGALYSVYGPIASGGVPNIDGQYLSNFDPSGWGGSRFPIVMSFATPQTEAAFAYTGGAGTTTISAYLGSSLVETYSIASRNDYLGFQNITFDAISVYTEWGGWGWVDAVFVDNIQLPTASPSSVPEPSIMLLLGIGLAGLVGARRRKS
jgi:hypothetical protein